MTGLEIGNDGVEIWNDGQKSAATARYSSILEICEKFAKGQTARLQSRACARRTLILAFSHKGRRDPLAAIRAWFRSHTYTVAWVGGTFANLSYVTTRPSVIISCTASASRLAPPRRRKPRKPMLGERRRGRTAILAHSCAFSLMFSVPPPPPPPRFVESRPILPVNR